MQILHYKSLSSLVERNVFEKLEPAYEPFLKQNVFFFLLPDFSNLFIIVSLIIISSFSACFKTNKELSTRVLVSA